MQFLRKKSDLRNYQLSADEFIRGPIPGALMLLKPGFGKTGITLTAIRELIDCLDATRVLVIAPLLVAEETWPTEIDEWEHTRVLTYEIITGDDARRRARAKINADIHIINKENVVWLREFWGDDWPYDMLVVDESSCFKNPARKTKPNKAKMEAYLLDPKNNKKPKANDSRFGALCAIRRHLTKIVLLTGTPAPNGLLDLWSQVYLIDGGERLGSSFNGFRNRYFVSDFKGFKWTPREGAFDTIMGKIRDITFALSEADHLQLPELIVNPIVVQLPNPIIKQYREFKKTLVLSEHDILAVNEGVLTGKLLQFANGSVYNEGGDDVFIHDCKYQALDLLLDELGDAPVLIAYSYQFDLEGLRKRYPDAEVLGESDGQVKRWNQGLIPKLLLHPAAGAYGLNLQRGGCHTVWFGLPWSLEWFIQLNKRLHRPGQLYTTFLHIVLAKDTDDERVLKVLDAKDATQEAVFAATMHAL